MDERTISLDLYTICSSSLYFKIATSRYHIVEAIEV